MFWIARPDENDEGSAVDDARVGRLRQLPAGTTPASTRRPRVERKQGELRRHAQDDLAVTAPSRQRSHDLMGSPPSSCHFFTNAGKIASLETSRESRP
jgi:hypothetical protein